MNFTGFEGLAKAEQDLFAKHLAGITGSGLEIGCLDGFSTRVILAAAPGLFLTSIDPLVPDSMEPSLQGRADRLLCNMRPYLSRWAFVQDYSHHVAELWHADGVIEDAQKLDFMFIDGDHNYGSACQDFDDWVPYLRVGGLLAVHDSRMNRPGGAPFHPGPSRMADERIYDNPAWQIVGEAFSLTLARKV